MKALIVRDTAGKVQSVAVLNPKLAAGLKLEVDGATVQEVDLDGKAIRRDDLIGKKGLKAQKKAHETLDTLTRGR